MFEMLEASHNFLDSQCTTTDQYYPDWITQSWLTTQHRLEALLQLDSSTDPHLSRK